MAFSLAEAAAMSGMSVTFASPITHRPPDAFLARVVELGKAHNVTARAFTSPMRAVRDVDVVYTDVWTSMGDEAFSERNAAALRPYQVNAELMAAAAPHALFMHCLPAHRGEEVTRGGDRRPAKRRLRPSRKPPARAEGAAARADDRSARTGRRSVNDTVDANAAAAEDEAAARRCWR